ncbi:MAG: hypothetical protein HYY48_06955 [Gammaproteobacteria bacterium]|nr:hypothetical protein [Gammaproteobacteria bacterium]
MACWLCACALSPQTVRINPVLDVSQLASRGQGTTIALNVIDARAGKTVGYRGGVYATASISTDAGMAAAVRTEIARAFGQLGYRVVEPGADAGIALEVEIAELGYAVTEDRVTRTVATVAAVRARATSGSITRTGDYRDRRTKEVLKAPSESENEALLNDVLSASLQRLVADPDLLKF